jgi:hypothetical protein
MTRMGVEPTTVSDNDFLANHLNLQLKLHSTTSFAKAKRILQWCYTETRNRTWLVFYLLLSFRRGACPPWRKKSHNLYIQKNFFVKQRFQSNYAIILRRIKFVWEAIPIAIGRTCDLPRPRRVNNHRYLPSLLQFMS